MSQKGGTYRPSAAAEDTQLQHSSRPSIPASVKYEKQQEYCKEKSDVCDSHTAERSVSASEKISEKMRYSDPRDDDDREWEFVSIPDESESQRDGSDNAFEFHYDLTVGCGKWKHTLVSVDVTSRSQ
ncbi:hypothetical protein F5B22DRAFT_288123 [Xylaria bambusicola]|uniref:uncharacterized protein n=1 Tax=Xylaria bambusicola TaxID=326684 RepID=UPI00200828E8|nr:uncharacterized protein F5B22DRAFT_288123 [Xylaria bambusicola]KAI0512885.1 hypothetical protein F5B22DRAFT_288123 [Xylaria bambusicola]